MREIDTTYEIWSKRRIIIGLLAIVIMFGIGFAVKEIAVKQIASFKNLYKTKVAGVSTKKEQDSLDEKSKGQPQSFKWKEDMQEKLDLLKKEVGGLNVSDLASSSPQIKKLINDLQGLEQLPRNQAKEACYNICKGL